MTLLFEHSPGFLLPIVALAALVAWLLYRRDKNNAHFSSGLRISLALFRFLTLLIVSFFLLEPLVRSSERELENPILLIAQDNSSSIIQTADSQFNRNAYPEKLRAFVERLGVDYDVRTYTFGERFGEQLDSLDFSERSTDISEVLTGLYNRYSNRNVGAIVLASDGITNSGTNPLYSARKLNAPIYTVAMGDTTRRRDLRITEVAVNRIAYLGNRFPMEIVAEARKAAGLSSRIQVEHKGKVIYNELFSLSNDYELETRRLTLDASDAGLQKYTVTVSPVEGEVSLVNNRKEVFVDVLENRQKILIAGAAPHPDLAALRLAISSNLNYEVEAIAADDFTGAIDEYSLVVLHRIPAKNKQGQQLLNELVRKARPFVLVLGAEVDYNAFNALKLGYSLSGYRESMTDVYGSYAQGFPHFNIDDDTKRMFRDLPPLSVPFGDFQAAPGVTSLTNRRVGTIETDVPLISFNQVNGAKIGVIGGEGIWRWRMVDFLKEGNHNRFDRLISSMVQYLASRDDRKRFKVSAPRDVEERDRIVFRAEVYNAAYEPVTAPDVSLSLTTESGDRYEYVLGRTGNGYRVEIGNLPAGSYNWEATTAQGGESFTERGEFTISAVLIESANLEADHSILYRLALENNGAMFTADEFDALEDAIRSSDQVVTLSYERTRLTDLINWRIILFILIALLSTEWLLRKWSGSY